MNINLNVRFFENEIVNSIGAGIYEIYVQVNDKEELLYIGESVFVLVRCATHLYEIAKGNGYLGFKEEILENKNVTVVFKLYTDEDIADILHINKERKAKEKEIISKKSPRMQSGISDRVKPIEEMIEEMMNFLRE